MKEFLDNKNYTCVAVSKTKPNEKIKELYDIGYRHFGENKVQEMVIKNENLPSDIFWHMIGHLQTNKVKMIVPFVHLIHSVDSIKVLSKINNESKKINKKTNCLIQINISNEESKYGFLKNEVMNLFLNNRFNEYENIKIKGLMGMASFSENDSLIKNEFRTLKKFYENIKKKKNKKDNNINFKILSMGMSNDYKIALDVGSNMIRIGSLLFGKRNY